MSSSSSFSSVFLLPQFFLWMWVAFFLIKEKLMKKKATHIQMKNCGSGNTEEKQLPELIGGWGYY